MNTPPKIVPFGRFEEPAPEDDFDPADYEGLASTVVSKLRTSRGGREAQLWICLEANDSLTLTWMRPTSDPNSYDPMPEMGSLSLDPDEMDNLAEALRGAKGTVARLVDEQRSLR